VPDRADHPIVILYEHPLLGEGIARYVATRAGVPVTVAAARDIDGIRAALACDPSVVIFELGARLHDVDLARLAPHAELIDVSDAMANHPATSSDARLDRILQAVRRHAARANGTRAANGVQATKPNARGGSGERTASDTRSGGSGTWVSTPAAPRTAAPAG
jgi:hypothetical protein